MCKVQSDKEYAADCIEFLRGLAQRVRDERQSEIDEWDADKLDEIATSLQVDTQEPSK